MVQRLSDHVAGRQAKAPAELVQPLGLLRRKPNMHEHRTRRAPHGAALRAALAARTRNSARRARQAQAQALTSSAR